MPNVDEREIKSLLDNLRDAERAIKNVRNRTDASMQLYEWTQLGNALDTIKDSLKAVDHW